MPTKKNGAPAPKQMTAKEMSEWIQSHDKDLKNYEATLDPLKQLRDVTKSATSTTKSVSKERVINWLQYPNRNESKIRDTSWYLMSRSQIYARIIMYYATMFYLDARSIIPSYDPSKNMNDKQILRSYVDTVQFIHDWNINNEMLKMIITAFVQDVSYNVCYADKTGLYLLPLPADKCRLIGQYTEGDFCFAIDMQYFRSNQELIEWWGEPFTTMWKNYQDDTINGRWQIIPEEYSACFKFRSYDWSLIIPPFSGVFGSLIDLLDIENVQAVADQQEVFKMLVYEMETITGSKNPDDWKVNPEISKKYFSRMVDEALPDYCSAAMIPGKLDVIDFSNSDKTSENNKILNATKNVLNSSGGAQVLNSATISGSTAYHYSILTDTDFAISTLLPQIEGWMNRILKIKMRNPSKIKFYHVGRLDREDFRKEMLENAQYSLPSKLSVMSLEGLDPLETLSLNHLEDDILGLGDKFNSPLSSSFTTSNKTDNTKSDTELTDEGEASRDKEVN